MRRPSAQSLNLDFQQAEGLAAAEAGSGTPPSAPPALFATPWQAVEAPALARNVLACASVTPAIMAAPCVLN